MSWSDRGGKREATDFTPFAIAAATQSAAAMRTDTLFPDLDIGVPPAAERAETSPPTILVTAAEAAAARDAAWADGYTEGRRAAEAELQDGAGAFAIAIEEVARFRAGLLERYQTQLLELALGVARKVMQRELSAHPEHWLGMIRDAVMRTLDREWVRIRVGPILHRFVLEQLPELRVLLEEVRELDLIEDPGLGEMGCVVETGSGDLDLGIDTQIEAIRAALTEPTR
jgi:flagellar assembly protein FliH